MARTRDEVAGEGDEGNAAKLEQLGLVQAEYSTKLRLNLLLFDRPR